MAAGAVFLLLRLLRAWPFWIRPHGFIMPGQRRDLASPVSSSRTPSAKQFQRSLHACRQTPVACQSCVNIADSGGL